MLRMLGLAALLAAIVVGYLLFGRSSASNEGQGASQVGEVSPSSGANAGESSVSGQGAAMVPAPVRMRSDSPETTTTSAPSAATDSLAESFANETVDKELAAVRSTMIREVTAELLPDVEGAAEIHELECRTHHCLLQIAGDDEKSVIALVDALQDERGFLGKAESLMLSREGDVIQMYLRFAETAKIQPRE